MNKDQVKGRAKKIEGELIDQRGDARGSAADDLKGKAKKGVGEVQKQWGDLKEKARDSDARRADDTDADLGRS